MAEQVEWSCHMWAINSFILVIARLFILIFFFLIINGWNEKQVIFLRQTVWAVVTNWESLIKCTIDTLCYIQRSADITADLAWITQAFQWCYHCGQFNQDRWKCDCGSSEVKWCPKPLRSERTFVFCFFFLLETL